MRILMISYTSLLQRAYRAKCEVLARLPGVELTVLTPDHWKEKWSSGRPVLYEAGEGPEPYRSIRAAIVFAGNGHLAVFRGGVGRWMTASAPDVIDLEREPWSWAAAQAVWSRNRRCPRARLVFHASQNAMKWYPPPFRQIESYVYGRADCALARSETAAGVLRSRGFGGRIEVVPHGVDAGLFMPAAGPVGGEPVIGFVGALTPQKGIETLLEAVARLTVPARALIVGNGPERGALEARSLSPDLAGRVEFAGSVPHRRIPELLRRMTVFVLPSVSLPGLEERFGRVLLEAMAAGIPVIASDSGEIPRVVGNAGIIVPEGEPEALARALDELLAHPERAADLGRRARERVERMYSWEVVARRTFEIYQDLRSC